MTRDFDPQVDEYDRGYWDAFDEVLGILELNRVEMKRRGWINMEAGTRRDVKILKNAFGKGRNRESA